MSKSIVVPLTGAMKTPFIVGTVAAILVTLLGVVVVFMMMAGAWLSSRKKQQFSHASQGK